MSTVKAEFLKGVFVDGKPVDIGEVRELPVHVFKFLAETGDVKVAVDKVAEPAQEESPVTQPKKKKGKE